MVDFIDSNELTTDLAPGKYAKIERRFSVAKGEEVHEKEVY